MTSKTDQTEQLKVVYEIEGTIRRAKYNMLNWSYNKEKCASLKEGAEKEALAILSHFAALCEKRGAVEELTDAIKYIDENTAPWHELRMRKEKLEREIKEMEG